MRKARLTKLSRRYQAALHRHLQGAPRTRSPAAKALGRQAVVLGLETLDLVRIHEQALAVLRLPKDASRVTAGRIRRAGRFFTEAISPIEKTHRAALKANVHLRHLSARLSQRTQELAASHRHLQQASIRRRRVDAALKKSGQHRNRLLATAGHPQHRLQQLTRRLLAAQEDNRRKMSRELHDEIAQILLGLQVRLLGLTTGAAANDGKLKKEIASTQRLVEKSTRAMSRFARQFGLRHET